jgi:DNA (cytosine-5)-methyltransferase 1
VTLNQQPPALAEIRVGDVTTDRTEAGARIGSLCSGYGGLELGLLTTMPGTVLWHCENDKHASKILAERWPGVPNLHDIKAVDWHDVEPVDWLCAGYPCQPFSDAGKRLGEDDERHLWPYVAAAIRVLRPRRVLLENVAGHFARGFGSVLGDLAALRYDATWACVRAADAGAPHNRARVFIHAADTGSERHGSGQDGRSVGRVDREDASETPQRERPRPIPSDRGAAAIANADLIGCEGPDRRQPRVAAPEPCALATDAQGDRRDERRAEPAGIVGRPDAALGGSPADAREGGWESLATVDGAEPPLRVSDADGPCVEWGAYEPAIRRWERILGRRAPRPTEPGRNGRERLSPVFVEWMQGLDEGWVTDVDIPRNAQLAALGNGVVPQQAALALRTLMPLTEAAA